jgi:hypothetical protein
VDQGARSNGNDAIILDGETAVVRFNQNGDETGKWKLRRFEKLQALWQNN